MESVEKSLKKNMKTGKVTLILKKKKKQVKNYFFQSFGNFASFHVFHDLTTDFACWWGGGRSKEEGLTNERPGSDHKI